MAETLCQALQGRVETVDLILTTKAGESRAAANRPGADCVVAVGGDGSVNEVANGLGESDTLLAILPAGTANVVARELRIPSDPAALAALIAARQVRWMDVGVHGDRRFLLGAGAGLDAAVAERVARQRGKRSSLSKWVWPSIATVRTYTFPEFRVIVDGHVLTDRAQYAIVGNCRYSAGIFPATPEARIDDGLLDVCVLQNLGLLRLLGLLSSARRGTHIHRKDVVYRQGRSVELRPLSDERVPLQVDGDAASHLPAVFGVIPKAVQVVAPGE